ncbi:Matrix metalloproteinase-14 [Trichinella papuae]|uniref:Matrix metalloproteinase-14 n=1 Tax=Trichinella papuae TaxID=268474 RepID=A0A0V1N0J4_9BILA|nr:Matrix metalloproteinase-14 [Trichinella papuae]
MDVVNCGLFFWMLAFTIIPCAAFPLNWRLLSVVQIDLPCSHIPMAVDFHPHKKISCNTTDSNDNFIQNNNNNNNQKLMHNLVAAIDHLMRTHRRTRHRRKKLNLIKEALIYLRKYGYLKNGATAKSVEAALKTFQETAGIQQTGELDGITVEHLRKSRCGNSDIDQRVISLSSRKKRFTQVSKWVGRVDHNDLLHLKWKINKFSNKLPIDETKNVVKKALQIWSDQLAIPSIRNVKLLFTESKHVSDADIGIMWASGEHGDEYPFDGAGNSSNILAHTFYPNYQPSGTLNGDIHFDESENWTLDLNGKATDSYFPYVLVHEIGHALGLGHSKRQDAVMNPIYKQIPLSSINLDIDDKCALNWNYIGPSNICLFVWLMVELLPRARSNSLLSVQYAPMSLEKTLLQPMRLRKSNSESNTETNWSLMKCTEENQLKNILHTLLKENLNLSNKQAAHLGEKLCNFLDGQSLKSGEQKMKKNMENVWHKKVFQREFQFKMDETELLNDLLFSILNKEK